MWHILEHTRIPKIITKLPPQVVRKYELWKDIVYRHGPAKLKEFPGFHDESLAGDRSGQRSSRLHILYRVLYEVEKESMSVYVIEIAPQSY